MLYRSSANWPKSFLPYQLKGELFFPHFCFFKSDSPILTIDVFPLQSNNFSKSHTCQKRQRNNRKKMGLGESLHSCKRRSFSSRLRSRFLPFPSDGFETFLMGVSSSIPTLSLQWSKPWKKAARYRLTVAGFRNFCLVVTSDSKNLSLQR